MVGSAFGRKRSEDGILRGRIKQGEDAPAECGLDGNMLLSRVLQSPLMDHRETGELGGSCRAWCIGNTFRTHNEERKSEVGRGEGGSKNNG